MRTRHMSSFERRLRMNVTDAEIKILQTLALRGPLSQVAISKETGFHWVSVHEAIKFFEDVHWVYVLKIEKSETNVPMKIYSLSVYGLLMMLENAYVEHLNYEADTLLNREKEKPERNQPTEERLDLWERIDTVAEKNEHIFPLIFSKWSFFRRKKVLEHAKKRLIMAILQTRLLPLVDDKTASLSGESFSVTAVIDSPQIEKENKFWVANLLLFFYGPSENYSFRHTIYDTSVGRQVERRNKEAESQALDEWLEAVCSDLELRNWTLTFCRIREDELLEKMELYHEEIKRYFSKLDKP